jgi:hypothetical protein
MPDEQIELMLAYMAIVAEMQSDPGAQVMATGRAAEAKLQADEAQAWASSRRQVIGDG